MHRIVIVVDLKCGDKTCLFCNHQNWDDLQDEGVRCDLFKADLDLCGEDDCYRCTKCLTAEAAAMSISF